MKNLIKKLQTIHNTHIALKEIILYCRNLQMTHTDMHPNNIENLYFKHEDAVEFKTQFLTRNAFLLEFRVHKEKITYLGSLQIIQENIANDKRTSKKVTLILDISGNETFQFRGTCTRLHDLVEQIKARATKLNIHFIDVTIQSNLDKANYIENLD